MLQIVDYFAITIVWYVASGLFRLLNDFAQPKYNQPEYIRDNKLIVMLSVFLLWPFINLRMLMLKKKFTGKSIRKDIYIGICVSIIGLLLTYFIYSGISRFLDKAIARSLLTILVVCTLKSFMGKLFFKRYPRTV
jgi:hypothetical protein